MGVFKDFLNNEKIQILDTFMNIEDKHLLRQRKDLSVGIQIICDFLNSLIKETEELCHHYIGIYINQNVYASAIILGCIKSEKPFVYLDVEAGCDLSKYMIGKLNISAIFTLSRDSDSLIKALKSPLLLYEFDLWDRKLQVWKTGEAIKTEPGQQKLMYAAQTSGSTGYPKIVQVPEQAILPNIIDLKSKWNITDDDVILLASPPTFDPFLVELLLAVTTGAAILTVPTEVRANSSCLLDILFPSHCPPLVTVVQLTPSLFMRWTTEQIRSRVLTANTSLRVLALGGEKFPSAEFWDRCREPGNKTQIFSLYGTTELSCWAMLGQGNDNMGSTLSETLLSLCCDSNNKTGELLIGSETRICLVGEESWEQLKPPVYRATGDIVSVENGVYRYIGRKDNMVKRWGYRVSLEQVEQLARSCTEVAEACCVLLQSDCLCLFVTLNTVSPTIDLVRKEIKSLLLSHLNKASIPDMIIQQETIPLTRHGKLDRTKLGQILLKLKEEDVIHKSPIELFQVLWEKYTIHSEENSGFLSVGGNSVTAMIIMNRMSELNENLPTTVINEMLNNASLLECCNLIRGKRSKKCIKMPFGEGETSTPVEKKLKTSFQDKMLLFQMKGSVLLTDLVSTYGNKVELRIKWIQNMGKCVDSSPTCIIYQSGKCVVVIGSHSGKLIALDLDHATVIWCLQLPDRIESSLTPSLCGTLGLIGCYDGHVYCLKLESGAIVWSFKTQAIVKCIPLQVADTWIFGSYDYCVYCLKNCDGGLVWKHRMRGIVLTTPLQVLKLNVVIVACLTGQVAALHCKTGNVLWFTSFHSPIFSSPCLSAGLILVAEVTGSLHALKSNTGTEVWQYQTKGKVFSSLSVLEDVVLIGCHDNHIYCLQCNQEDGDLLWKVDLASAIYGTPCWVTPHLICAASTAGTVFILDVVSGSILTKVSLPGLIFSSPVFIKQSVVIGCRDDNIYCLHLINT